MDNLLEDQSALRAMLYLIVSQLPDGKATIPLSEAAQKMVLATHGDMEMRYVITDDALILETRK